MVIVCLAELIYARSAYAIGDHISRDQSAPPQAANHSALTDSGAHLAGIRLEASLCYISSALTAQQLIKRVMDSGTAALLIEGLAALIVILWRILVILRRTGDVSADVLEDVLDRLDSASYLRDEEDSRDSGQESECPSDKEEDIPEPRR